jgi:hypothetical protein
MVTNRVGRKSGLNSVRLPNKKKKNGKRKKEKGKLYITTQKQTFTYNI